MHIRHPPPRFPGHILGSPRPDPASLHLTWRAGQPLYVSLPPLRQAEYIVS